MFAFIFIGKPVLSALVYAMLVLFGDKFVLLLVRLLVTI